MRRWLRDPLTHFVLLGLLAFAVYDPSGRDTGDPEIVVTAADVQRLRAAWQAQWSRPPNAAELDGLIESFVHEEMLVREALALGLDRDDLVVRRRLAQKMEFLASEPDEEGEPGDAELEAFRVAHADRFRTPGTTTFRQVYLSRDRRGEATPSDAKAVLAALRAGADPAGQGDPLLLPSRQEAVSQARVGQLFGDDFAEALARVRPGGWQGPLRSSYGLHLVLVEERTPPRDPPLEEMRDRVLLEWRAERGDRQLQAYLDRLRERYPVRVEPDAR